MPAGTGVNVPVFSFMTVFMPVVVVMFMLVRH